MLNLSNIPKLKEVLQAPSETQVCTQCEHEKDVNAFGWRFMFEQRLEICKYCRNLNAKKARIIAQFKHFNRLTVMSWKPKK